MKALYENTYQGPPVSAKYLSKALNMPVYIRDSDQWEVQTPNGIEKIVLTPGFNSMRYHTNVDLSKTKVSVGERLKYTGSVLGRTAAGLVTGVATAALGDMLWEYVDAKLETLQTIQGYEQSGDYCEFYVSDRPETSSLTLFLGEVGISAIISRLMNKFHQRPVTGLENGAYIFGTALGWGGQKFGFKLLEHLSGWDSYDGSCPNLNSST